LNIGLNGGKWLRARSRVKEDLIYQTYRPVTAAVTPLLARRGAFIV